ncbi:MAG: hypothetical protein Q9195_005681 [Heterodermia aff. obscurata]
MNSIGTSSVGSTPGLIVPERGRVGGRIYLLDEGPEDDTESESSVSGESQEEESGEDEVEGYYPTIEAGAASSVGSTPGLIDPTRGRVGGRIYLLDEGPEDDTESESSVSSESEEEECCSLERLLDERPDLSMISEAEFDEDLPSAQYSIKDEKFHGWKNSATRQVVLQAMRSGLMDTTNRLGKRLKRSVLSLALLSHTTTKTERPEARKFEETCVDDT